MEKIKAQILKILSEYTDADLTQLSTTDTLESIGVDSLSLVEIIFDIEELFDISIPDDAELKAQGFSLQHVDDVTTLVVKLCAQKT